MIGSVTPTGSGGGGHIPTRRTSRTEESFNRVPSRMTGPIPALGGEGPEGGASP